MKKIVFILSLIGLCLSCKNKELCYLDHPHGGNVKVVIHWNDTDRIPAKGMRTNLFSLGNHPNFGINDMSSRGGVLNIPYGKSYMALCYDYFGTENIFFSNENDSTGIEARSQILVRSTYSKAYPSENTVSEACPFYAAKVERFENPFSTDTVELHFFPQNVTSVYTFEVINIRGAQFITATRGALSGLSASYFISTRQLSTSSSTVLCDAAPDVPGGRITGTVSTFGRVAGMGNIFTIEILYPSAHNGIIQMSWDVTSQVDIGNHIIVNADLDIIPDANGGGSAFQTDVREWEEITVPLPM